MQDEDKELGRELLTIARQMNVPAGGILTHSSLIGKMKSAHTRERAVKYALFEGWIELHEIGYRITVKGQLHGS
ncbi:hypothetical protein DYI24_00875 [Rhodopseudomonas sp. BR0C11]|uniref:hypothetical protein n=1 Tax=Rhodopseudomonas sp. BR0C11 TaxID=2269370 RepID=UPI0013E0733B|nr:hypothetical protein [Rhodopseudomonas sp. BR0C11]NEV75625.1 hypothetical protein [Rhodopseudomonas sp. BR0C11]